MYQFPDSTGNEQPLSSLYPEPVELETPKKQIKFILIANVLLVLFVVVASIVWFLFFFDSSEKLTLYKLPATQKLSGDFTPIIIENNQEPITNNIVKNNDIQTITKIIAPEQKAEKSEVKTTIKYASNTNQQPEKLSAIDAITRELEKNQLKTKVAAPNRSLSHGRSLKTQESPEKNSQIQQNQVVITIPQNTLLEKTLVKTKQNLSHSEHILIEQLENTSTPSNTTVNKKEKNNNIDIINSVSLQKSKDIDKIMAAMGSIKKPSSTTSREHIENKIKSLITIEKNKYRETDLYERKLETEAKINNNEMRILTVKKGESIWDIAVRAYNDGNKYKKILDANPLIKKNPALLKAGITLRVPL